MKEIIIGYLFAFIITIVSSLIYTLLGFNNLSNFVNNYLIYILLIYYIITIIYLYRKNKRKEPKLAYHNYFPNILLGISVATAYNMLVFRFSPLTSTTTTPLILLIISTGIIGPIFEEILFRYIFYNRLKKKYSIKTAILINSIVFALIHMTPINMLYAFILGIILNLSYEKYQSIISPILIHIAGNIIVLFLTGYNTIILVLSIINLILSIFIVNQRHK